MSDAIPVVRVTEIGEFIRHQSCDRRFKLDINNRIEARRGIPFFERLFNPLDLVLQESGDKREDEWQEQLNEAGFASIGPKSLGASSDTPSPDEEQEMSWRDFALGIKNLSPNQPAYARQVKVEAVIGSFHVVGKIDFILVLWKNGTPNLRIIECKASRRDRTYHRIQVELYSMIVQSLAGIEPLSIQGRDINPQDIECVIARIDERTNRAQDIVALEPLESLDQEKEDIERLLADNGRLMHINRSDIQDLDYQINEKCNTCVFNIYCLPDSGIRHSLELLGLEPSVVRTLSNAGIMNIDQLADLDLAGEIADHIRRQISFSENLEILKLKARARLHTLPGGDTDIESYEVQPLPFYSDRGQLPEHTISGQRLIRVYLSIDYDYVENRIGALAAHVTKSEGFIYTGFIKVDEEWQPDPEIKEAWPTRSEGDERVHFDVRAPNKSNRTISRFKTSEWTGRYDEDTAAERELIQGFLHELTESISDIAEARQAPIHFYVWSRSEMSHLVEACSRAGSALLSHLNELLGCRRGLEQLIYSCLQEEVNNRFSLGWTGRGLVVATSLKWFGWRYHWRRHVGGSDIDLDRVFTQDLFDFKTTLAIKRVEIGPDRIPRFIWADTKDKDAFNHRFEIRCRFFDSLPAPYWHSIWRTLPNPNEVENKSVANAIDRYNAVREPGRLKAYLNARTQALRWIEERIRFKNPDIEKPPIDIPGIMEYTLGVDSTRRSAIDFLQLDQHVRVTDWIAAHLVPPAYRVSSGRSIPVRDVQRRDDKLVANISLDGYSFDYDVLEANCSIGEGSFIRLTPCSCNPYQGQTIRQLLNAGSTCKVCSIDWCAREIVLKVIPMIAADNYRLQSMPHSEEGAIFECATVDESPSDFVAPRVEKTLLNNALSPVYRWFDPENPQIPQQHLIEEILLSRFRQLLESLTLPEGNNLDPDQIEACIAGLNTRIQLLQGPPGTGKTNTTAVAVLLRVLARSSVGDVIVVAASTHTAVDNLLQRIDHIIPAFERCARSHGFTLPPIHLAKATLSDNDPNPGGNVELFSSNAPARFIGSMRRSSVAIIGGTTGSLLKMWEKRGSRLQDLQISILFIDEASMMVFPHFLALATLIDTGNGEIMLAGDHRQLAPIVAHDWENEDRPPVVLYQPFASSYEAIQNIEAKVPATAVSQKALRYTHRLPAEIRELIGRLYKRDHIELDGRPQEQYQSKLSATGWESMWERETGLYLVVHNERQSKLSNEIELAIIEQILASCGTQPAESIAIVTPHRGQRGLLKRRLAPHMGPVGPIYVIDTVERLQGGQRQTIIVSATESDPSAISMNAEFILDLRRSNVAFSRAKMKLIVVCSESLLDYIPAEFENYESTLLWKSLRTLCSRGVMSTTLSINDNSYEVRIFTYVPNEEDSGQ